RTGGVAVGEDAAGGRASRTVGRLEGKVALITGAGSGIGRAAARAFAAQGARLVLADISGEQDALAAELGDEALAVHADVTSSADVARAVAHAEERFGGLHVLMNNAGA